jgi:hypothetical protein
MLFGVVMGTARLNSDAFAPLIVMLEIVSGLLPVLATVTVLAALAAPPRTSSKISCVWLVVMFGSSGRNSVIVPLPPDRSYCVT